MSCLTTALCLKRAFPASKAKVFSVKCIKFVTSDDSFDFLDVGNEFLSYGSASGGALLEGGDNLGEVLNQDSE